MSPNQLVLGTVELGMLYGLNNTTGQPSQEESFAILDAAYVAGILTLDTAWSYGSAEDVIGAWLKHRGVASTVRLVSKMKPHVLDAYPPSSAVVDVVRSEIKKSLSRLGIEKLDGYLLHTPEYIYNNEIVAALKQMKQEGFVRNIGVSTYDEPEALHALETGIDYIQVPYNALDQRLERTNFFERAHEAGVVVFARSPFLQGLLLMKSERIPAHLAHARELVETFQDVARRHGVPIMGAALRFAQSSRAEHVVFGVETLSQLKEILSLPPMNDEYRACIEDIRTTFQYIDRAIVNPSLWKKN